VRLARFEHEHGAHAGLSQGEIAKEIGISRVTVSKKIRAIRAGAEAWLGRIAPTETAR